MNQNKYKSTLHDKQWATDNQTDPNGELNIIRHLHKDAYELYADWNMKWSMNQKVLQRKQSLKLPSTMHPYIYNKLIRGVEQQYVKLVFEGVLLDSKHVMHHFGITTTDLDSHKSPFSGATILAILWEDYLEYATAAERDVFAHDDGAPEIHEYLFNQRKYITMDVLLKHELIQPQIVSLIHTIVQFNKRMAVLAATPMRMDPEQKINDANSKQITPILYKWPMTNKEYGMWRSNTWRSHFTKKIDTTNLTQLPST
eukprot:1063803_1